MDIETEIKIRQIIKDEMGKMIGRAVFDNNIQILDARNIQVGKASGTKIATATDQKLGFYGATPVVRADYVADAASAGSSYSQSDAATWVTAINGLLNALRNLGLMESS